MNIISEDDFPPIHYIREDIHCKFDENCTLEAIRSKAIMSAVKVSCFTSSKEWKEIDEVSQQCSSMIEDYTDTIGEDGSRVLEATLRHCRVMYSSATNDVSIFFAPHIVEKFKLKETTKQKSNGHWKSAEVLLAYDERLDYAFRWMEMTEKWEATVMTAELATLDEIENKLGSYKDVFEYEMSVQDTYVTVDLYRNGATYEQRMGITIHNDTWKNDLKQALSRFFISTLKETKKEIADKECYCTRIIEAASTI